MPASGPGLSPIATKLTGQVGRRVDVVNGRRRRQVPGRFRGGSAAVSGRRFPVRRFPGGSARRFRARRFRAVPGRFRGGSAGRFRTPTAGRFRTPTEAVPRRFRGGSARRFPAVPDTHRASGFEPNPAPNPTPDTHQSTQPRTPTNQRFGSAAGLGQHRAVASC